MAATVSYKTSLAEILQTQTLYLLFGRAVTPWKTPLEFQSSVTSVFSGGSGSGGGSEIHRGNGEGMGVGIYVDTDGNGQSGRIVPGHEKLPFDDDDGSHDLPGILW